MMDLYSMPFKEWLIWIAIISSLVTWAWLAKDSIDDWFK